MKKLFITFFLLTSTFCFAQTPVLFSLQNLIGPAWITDRSILIAPDQSADTPLWYGTNLVPTFPFGIQTTNGSAVASLVPWGYTIKVDLWPRSVHIQVPPSTNVLNAVNLINTNKFSPLNLNQAPQLNQGLNIALVTNGDGSITVGTSPNVVSNTATGISLNGSFTGNFSGTAAGFGGGLTGITSATNAALATNVVSGISITNATAHGVLNLSGPGATINLNQPHNGLSFGSAANTSIQDINTGDIFYNANGGAGTNYFNGKIVADLSGGTNLNPAAIAAAGGVMHPAFDANINRFCVSNAIYDIPTFSRLMNEVGLLKKYGIYTNGPNGNLVDWIIQKPGFCTNAFSFFGTPFTQSNISFIDSWGAHLSNSLISLPTTVDLHTNTIVVVWRSPMPDYNALSAVGGPTYVFGVGNPVTGSAVWWDALVHNFEQVFINQAATVWPIAYGSTFTNLVNFQDAVNVEYGRFETQPFERRVTALSLVGTNIFASDDGWNDPFNVNATANSLASTLSISEPLTNVIVGTHPLSSFSVFNGAVKPFQGEIEQILIYSTALNTNIAVGTSVATRALAPETFDDHWLGDSTGASLGIAQTNTVAYSFENRPVSNGSWVNNSRSGTKWNNNWSQPAASNYLFSIAEPPGVQRRFIILCGINDLYGNGDLAATCFGFIKTFEGWCVTNNTQLIIATVPAIATNCLLYNFSTAFETQRVLLNNMIRSNAWMFTGIIDRDALVTQSMLNTNNPLATHFTVDGLHFNDPTNGWYANQLIANLPWTVGSMVASWDGGCSVFNNGSGLTNICYPTNFALPTPPTGAAQLWSSNGFLFYVTKQHPNGVFIAAP